MSATHQYIQKYIGIDDEFTHLRHEIADDINGIMKGRGYRYRLVCSIENLIDAKVQSYLKELADSIEQKKAGEQ